MGLSIAGGPPRAATHKPLDLTRLMKLSAVLSDAADGGSITAEAIDELAEDEGVERSHLYAASILCDDVTIESSAAVTFVVCAGGCQSYGALDRLEDILDHRDDAELACNVAVRQCMDRCADGPVIQIHTPAGTATLARATKDHITESFRDLAD